MSQDQVRSTIHRCASTTNSCGWIRFTTSASIPRRWQCWRNVVLKPLSHHSFSSRLVLTRPASNTLIPPRLSDVDAVTTTTEINSPRVSTRPNVLRPEIFFPTSYPLVDDVTVDAPRTDRASMIDADGSGS